MHNKFVNATALHRLRFGFILKMDFIAAIKLYSRRRITKTLSVKGVTVQDHVALAKRVLSENTKVLYGIFGIIEESGYFPSRPFLNEFLVGGNDPCDQDGRMESWNPFELSETEYSVVLSWWQLKYPNAVVDNLNSDSWNDWLQEILEN